MFVMCSNCKCSETVSAALSQNGPGELNDSLLVTSLYGLRSNQNEFTFLSIRTTGWNRSCVTLHKTHTPPWTQNKARQQITSVCKDIEREQSLYVWPARREDDAAVGVFLIYDLFFKKGIKICVSKSMTGCVPPRTKSKYSNRYLYTALGNIPHNQKVK